MRIVLFADFAGSFLSLSDFLTCMWWAALGTPWALHSSQLSPAQLSSLEPFPGNYQHRGLPHSRLCPSSQWGSAWAPLPVPGLETPCRQGAGTMASSFHLFPSQESPFCAAHCPLCKNCSTYFSGVVICFVFLLLLLYYGQEWKSLIIGLKQLCVGYYSKSSQGEWRQGFSSLYL